MCVDQWCAGFHIDIGVLVGWLGILGFFFFLGGGGWGARGGVGRFRLLDSILSQLQFSSEVAVTLGCASFCPPFLFMLTLLLCLLTKFLEEGEGDPSCLGRGGGWGISLFPPLYETLLFACYGVSRT